MRAEHRDGVARQLGRGPLVTLRVHVREVMRELLDLHRASRAERRDLDLHDADSIVEVLAKLPLCDEALEILMGRADDADVGAERLPPTDALERALLQEAKELALYVVRQISDLVEEQRAALRHLDLAGHATISARERPALVTEQLAFHELHGQRRAIDRDERARLARRVDMDRPGKEAFSRTGLAAEEHRRIGLRRERHALIDRAQLVAPSHDAIERPSQREPRARRLGGAQRRQGEGPRDLRGERDEIALVLLVERRVGQADRRRGRLSPLSRLRGLGRPDSIEHLHDTAHRAPPLLADRHREDRFRGVPGRLVHRGIEARVGRGVRDAHRLAGPRYPARDTALERQAKRGQLRQERHAAHEIAVLRIDEPDGGALGSQRLRHALARRREQRIEVDLAREQRREIDEQRKAIEHRGFGRGRWRVAGERRRGSPVRDGRKERLSLEGSVRHDVLHAKEAPLVGMPGCKSPGVGPGCWHEARSRCP